jgi:hypothetical protein
VTLTRHGGEETMNRHRLLVGLPVVLLITGVLLLGGCGTEKEYAGSLVDTYDKAKETGTAGDMRAIGQALTSYQLDNGEFPSAGGIDTLLGQLSPDYLRMGASTDKWGNPLIYSATPGGYRLVSKGDDGREGTEDDIVLENGQLRTPSGTGLSF